MDSLDNSIGFDWDILIALSADDGNSWSAPQPLNSNAAIDSGADWLPQLAASTLGNWMIVWFSTDDLGGTVGDDEDVLSAITTDGGWSWTEPVPVNSTAASDSESDLDRFPSIATDRMGNWIAFWSSTNNLQETVGSDFDLLYARRMDGQPAWTDPIPFNSNATADTGS